MVPIHRPPDGDDCRTDRRGSSYGNSEPGCHRPAEMWAGADFLPRPVLRLGPPRLEEAAGADFLPGLAPRRVAFPALPCCRLGAGGGRFPGLFGP